MGSGWWLGGWWLVVSGLWLVVGWLVVRSAHHRQWRRVLGSVFAMSFCVAAVQHHGVLSDDALRYHWDGWIGAHGVDPYQQVPDHESHAPYHITVDGTTYPSDVPYSHLPTVYPPGAQILFATIAHVVGIDPLMWKVIWSALLLMLLFLIHRQLHEQERTWFWIAVTSPLFLVHAVADLHLDALMSTLTVLSLLAVRRNNILTGALLLALAVSLKYAPLVAVPFVLLNMTWRQRLLFVLTVAFILGVIVLPYLHSPLWGDLQNFLTNWKANAAVYDVARAVVPDRLHTRALLAGVVLCVLGVIWYRWRSHPYTMIALAMMALLIVSPVIHAWYLLTPLMMLPLVPLRSVMIWTATISIYAIFVQTYRTTGIWEEPPVLLALEALPVIVAYVIDVRRGAITAS